MQTAQQFQLVNKNLGAVSPAVCIETLYFEQQYNGQIYRTSLNNRLLVTGNKMNTVTKKNIQEALNNAELPFYYITKINSDTASGLYRLDVSLYSINDAVKSTTIINDISTRIEDTSKGIHDRITDLSTSINAYVDSIEQNFLKKTGGKMSGGIVFGNDDNDTKLPGIGYNGDNLILACPEDGYISLWGSLSKEYGMNTPGVTIKRPTSAQNGQVLVYNYASSQLVWSQYNAGALSYTTADYSKYYLLGITQQSFEERDYGATEFIATKGNIETNVYVHRKNVYANAFYQSSDSNLKTNIKHIDSDTYIPKVIQFNWLDTSLLSYGFIAQDLAEHNLEHLMEKDDNDNWRVNYSATLSLVVGDLQNKCDKLIKENTELKHEISTLNTTINSLIKRIEKLEYGTR